MQLMELLFMLIGFGAGLLTGWHFTGKYYRKLVTELIQRHCELTSQMRQEQAEQVHAGSTAASNRTSSSAA